jgi:hypothetical protein
MMNNIGWPLYHLVGPRFACQTAKLETPSKWFFPEVTTEEFSGAGLPGFFQSLLKL